MSANASIAVENDTPEESVIVIAGDWRLESPRPGIQQTLDTLKQNRSKLSFRCTGLEAWDSGLLTALCAIYAQAKEYEHEVDLDGLPEGAQKLLHLAFAVEEREGARREVSRESLRERIGKAAIDAWESCLQISDFIGKLTLSFGRFFRGKANYLKSDLATVIQEAGAEALPIIGLISFLMGMIFAFVGVIQLTSFGAGIYTADLVAVAMVREMAPIMTAILMAGRTGASYAAQIGTMKVNEELDALTTLGIDPIDFLALPRVIALVIMMPLLTMYSSLFGIIGGLAVGTTMLDISPLQYIVQTESAVTLTTMFGGLFKSVVYGSLVAVAGCMQGIQCGNNAMAVGQATTKAVVMGIVMIVVSAAVLTVIYVNLDI